MTEIITPSYLKAENIEGEVEAVVMDGGHVTPAEQSKFGRPSFELKVRIGEMDFLWSMNAASQRILSVKWGRDAEKWRGKRFLLRKEKVKAFGTERDVLRAVPMDD